VKFEIAGNPELWYDQKYAAKRWQTSDWKTLGAHDIFDAVIDAVDEVNEDTKELALSSLRTALETKTRPSRVLVTDDEIRVEYDRPYPPRPVKVVVKIRGVE
jgi:hypothetical protein